MNVIDVRTPGEKGIWKFNEEFDNQLVPPQLSMSRSALIKTTSAGHQGNWRSMVAERVCNPDWIK